MKVKTNFKQMYLVDTLLYNKLTLKDDPSVGWINQTPMNPNIHIHNKHAPPPYTPPPTLAPPPPHQPQPLLPSQPSSSQLPTTSTPLFITTSPSLTSVLPAATSTHTTARIQPSVDFLNTIYDVDDANVNEWMNNEQQNVKEWMNNEHQNVKEYRDGANLPLVKQKTTKDFRDDPIPLHIQAQLGSPIKGRIKQNQQTTEPMEIEQTSSSPKNRNKLRGNINNIKKVLKHNPTKLTYSEPLKSMLSHPSTPNITPYVLKLPQNTPHTPMHSIPSRNIPPPLQYNAPPPIDYNNPPPLQYNTPAHIEYNQPSPLQYTQLPQLEYKQTTPLTHNTSNENSQQCIECDNNDKTKITFKCTICNTDFKKKSSLMRHNRDFHDAFYQSERGIKRKTANKGSVKKRVKTTTRGVKRKPVMIEHSDNKKPNTEIVVYEPYNE